MANKKYTLYFKGENRFNHKFDMPIVSLPLKELDIYTSRYENYNELFESLPEETRTFINKEFDIKNLEDKFYVTDYDFAPIMDVIFKKDVDVLYINPKELEKLIIQKLMTLDEFQKSLLKTSSSFELKNKYNFFAYLYNTYVKDEPIAGMIDDYDVNKYASNLTNDDVMIASIATDKDNLIVLSKKLSQTLESRRNLAFEFKKVFNDLEENNNVAINDGIDIDYVLEQMIFSLNNFKKNYVKEFE